MKPEIFTFEMKKTYMSHPAFNSLPSEVCFSFFFSLLIYGMSPFNICSTVIMTNISSLIALFSQVFY